MPHCIFEKFLRTLFPNSIRFFKSIIFSQAQQRALNGTPSSSSKKKSPHHPPSMLRCKKGGRCPISLRTRKSCQRCRFERCLAVGMKPGWVLTEEEKEKRFRCGR